MAPRASCFGGRDVVDIAKADDRIREDLHFAFDHPAITLVPNDRIASATTLNLATFPEQALRDPLTRFEKPGMMDTPVHAHDSPYADAGRRPTRGDI
jgi:hypothetical protein